MSHRLFIIDDNPGDVELVTEALRETGSPVVVSAINDGEEALAALSQVSTTDPERLPDLILLDLNLIKLQGHAVLQRLKADPLLRAIPVVVYTSSQAAADISRSYQNGAAAYVIKPLGFGELVDLMRDFSAFWFSMVALPPHRQPYRQP